MRVITLLTDFGTRDYFVPSMKGVILKICKDVHIVDITHEVPPQNIRRGALILWACYKHFPRDTIHLVVVDPGVGTERRPIIVRSRNYYFVGPDNGVLIPAAEDDGIVRVYEIEIDKISRSRKISRTFHGRDIFAPAAALLAAGIDVEKIARPIENYERSIVIERPRRTGNMFQAQVIYIDRFGNVYTNIREEDLEGRPRNIIVKLGPDDKVLNLPFVDAYGMVPPGHDLALINSEGFLELSTNFGDFSKKYNVKELDKLIVMVEY
ncbi:MAG: SAM-dependent chlorinase/fluorinase [Crenarchaeota archaeon]|nr:SAM-dependent chlorinase/fluorinase [Thermoproteota archaeon]